MLFAIFIPKSTCLSNMCHTKVQHDKMAVSHENWSTSFVFIKILFFISHITFFFRKWCLSFDTKFFPLLNTVLIYTVYCIYCICKKKLNCDIIFYSGIYCMAVVIYVEQIQKISTFYTLSKMVEIHNLSNTWRNTNLVKPACLLVTHWKQ